MANEAREMHVAPVRAPWDYSEAPRPGEPAIPNEPTGLGRGLGAHLARMADAAEAADRKRYPDQHPRCNDCAFRAGTLPNGCEETLADAIKCVVERKEFLCHKGKGDRPCMGWVALQSRTPLADAVRVAAINPHPHEDHMIESNPLESARGVVLQSVPCTRGHMVLTWPALPIDAALAELVVEGAVHQRGRRYLPGPTPTRTP